MLALRQDWWEFNFSKLEIMNFTICIFFLLTSRVLGYHHHVCFAFPVISAYQMRPFNGQYFAFSYVIGLECGCVYEHCTLLLALFCFDLSLLVFFLPNSLLYYSHNVKERYKEHAMRIQNNLHNYLLSYYLFVKKKGSKWVKHLKLNREKCN